MKAKKTWYSDGGKRLIKKENPFLGAHGRSRAVVLLLVFSLAFNIIASSAYAVAEEFALTPDGNGANAITEEVSQELEENVPAETEETETLTGENISSPSEEVSPSLSEETSLSLSGEADTLALEQDGIYPVATAEGFSAAIAAIGASEETEATIVLGADLTDVNSVDAFQGVEGKKITITSKEGETHTLHISGECVLKGDVTLDRMNLSASGIYACGHTFETTADFTGKINAVYGGGPKGHDIAGGTNIVLRGGDVNYLHGGGHDSVVSGDVSILIDGSNAHISTLYGGGHAEETASGTVSGNVTVNMRQGTNGLFFGGGHNAYSKTDNEGDRDPGSVLGTVIVTFGYDGAPDKSVRPGESTFTYGGSYHSTVGNVVLNVTDGFTSEDPLGDRNLFGCGYNDTVLGTVEIHVYGTPDIGSSHIYGGGSTENQLGNSWPVCILNQANKESALYITYDVPSEVTAAADHHGINAGSDASIPMTIHGNVLVEVLGENMDYIVMDNENYENKNCTIDGTCTIRIANGGIIGQIQNNWKHFKDNDAADAVNDRVIYDGCGTAEAPQVSGYLYGFGEVVLQNNAHVLVSSNATGDFDSAQKPFYSVYGLTVEEGSTLKTTDAQAYIYGDAVVNGVWEQAYKKADNYNDLWVQGTLTVGSKGQLISLGTTNIKGAVTSQGTIALMNPALFQTDYVGIDAELRLPAVAAGSNYDGTDDGGVIPLNIDGAASGATMVYTVAPDDWQTLQKPNLGDNYITAFKQDANTPLQEVFLLGNADALADSLYLKRVDDPGVDDNSYFMWQVAKGILVIFDKNGGDTEAQPRIIALDLVPGQTEYTPGVPGKLPT